MDRRIFREIQMEQLHIFEEIDRLCSKNGLRYYIVGGTLLGAVRHGGFIPWDVDIDLVMERSDYDALSKICEEQLDNEYAYHDYKNTHNFTHPHAIVCKKNTRLFNKFDKYNRHIINYGIYIDVFPLDNTPKDEKRRIKHNKQLKFWKKLQELKVSYSYSSSFIKRAVHFLIRTFLTPVSLDWINSCFDKSMQKYNKESIYKIGAIGSGRFPYEKESMDPAIFGEPTILCFEGKEFKAPNQYKTWLERMYGDYMKVPSEAQQELGYSMYESVEF